MPRKLLWIMLVIAILSVLLNACTPQPELPHTPPQPRLQDVVDSAVQLQLWGREPLTGEEQLISDVTDPGILSGLAALLIQAEDVDNDDDRQLREYRQLLFRDAELNITRLTVYSGFGELLLGFGASLFRLPETFMTSMEWLNSLPQATGEIAEEDRLLLQEHGQSVVYRIATLQVTLPMEFTVEPGKMPLGAYWYASNILSRDIGLDFSSLLGQDVEITLYKLSKPLEMDALFFHSWGKSSRAVIMRCNGAVVGAWLDAGPGIGCSLDGHSFLELEPKGADAFNELVVGSASATTPEAVIVQYFAAIEAKGYAQAHSVEDILYIMEKYTFSGDDLDRLFYAQYPEVTGRYSIGLPTALRSCKVITVTPLRQEEMNFYYENNPLPPDAQAFVVLIEAEWEPEHMSGDWENGYNELVIATRPTRLGERIIDISPR